MNTSRHTHPWIGQSLARERSRRIGNVRYRLDLRIDSAGRVAHGQQVIEFELKAQQAQRDLPLDWRPVDMRVARAHIRHSLRINGQAAAGATLEHGHLRLPAHCLRTGHNRIEIGWRTPIGASGTAITRYVDPVDRERYIYTLFVPADASSVFPCFDQPDLKACFVLSLTVPSRWRAISNAPVARTIGRGKLRRIEFAPTEPISTYTFAFAAGPFVALAAGDLDDATHLWVRRSQRSRARAHAEAVLHLNRSAVEFFSRYCAHRFPFAKYDLVLIPEFPYRGMEHAGATFLAESSVLLADTACAHERFQRAQLVLHETAHQWMGDLVTMRWFDDLWLKEGFANFMAYKLAARIVSRSQAQLAFHCLSMSAYETDRTPGATALHYPLPDLAVARAVYGPIVYGKGPVVLREAECMLGPTRFRRAVRALVAGHAYGTIDWRDLVARLASEHGTSLWSWAEAWILRAGVPRLDAAERVSAPARGSHDRGHAYALTRLGAREIDGAAAALAHARSPLRRLQIWEALWQAVGDGRFAPIRFCAIALERLGHEANELVVANVLARVRSAIERLMSPEQQAHIAGAIEALLLDGAGSAHDPGTRLAFLRGHIEIARTDDGLARLTKILRACRAVFGVPITQHERLRAGAALIVRGACDPAQVIAALGTPAAERPRLRFVLTSARPERARKQAVLDRCLHDPSLPEHWIGASLEYLNHPAHARLTRALLPTALAAAPRLARTRKIFFVDRWLGAFIGGQHEQRALDVANAFARREGLDASLRLKVLEAADGLSRTVHIRARWDGKGKVVSKL